jgi:ABC-2 type transport system ATP-binding protein
VEPEAGHYDIAGISFKDPEGIRRKIGILPENNGFLQHLTGLEYLIYYGQSHGFPERVSKQKAQALLDEVGLDRKSKSPIGSYSHEMRQRIGIACALINDPVVIFLDEPTLGLASHSQQELLELTRQIARKRNIAVVLCTHLLTEVEHICDEVVVLNHGQIVDRGPVGEVLARAQQNVPLSNTMRVHVPSAALVETRQILEGMPNILKVTGLSEAEGWLEMELIPTTNGNSLNAYQTNKMLSALIRARIPIMSFGPKGARLPEL